MTWTKEMRRVQGWVFQGREAAVGHLEMVAVYEGRPIWGEHALGWQGSVTA